MEPGGQGLATGEDLTSLDPRLLFTPGGSDSFLISELTSKGLTLALTAEVGASSSASVLSWAGSVTVCGLATGRPTLSPCPSLVSAIIRQSEHV